MNRDILNGKSISAGLHSSDDWSILKADHRDKSLVCPVCFEKVIPKTSKLNTFFFAHRAHSNCASAGETAEHLFLKQLVEKSAIAAGWSATTEYRFEHNGNYYFADVLCTKGSAKIVIEIQWSKQSNAEFERRQQVYKDAGIRCAWLYRRNVRGRKTDDWSFDHHKTPIFDIDYQDAEDAAKNLEDIYVSTLNLSIDKFVKLLLHGRIQYSPKLAEKVFADVIYNTIQCWRCKKMTNVIRSISFYSEYDFIHLGRYSYYEGYDVSLINLDQSSFHGHGIGAIKKRYGHWNKSREFCNGCFHCDAYISDYQLNKQRLQKRLERNLETTAYYNPSYLRFEGRWLIIDDLNLVK